MNNLVVGPLDKTLKLQLLINKVVFLLSTLLYSMVITETHIQAQISGSWLCVSRHAVQPCQKLKVLLVVPKGRNHCHKEERDFD